MGELLGRDGELSELRGHLGACGDGPVRLAVVDGEAGIGKTTLVEATADRLRRDGFGVSWGRGVLDGGSPPYWLWQQLLGRPVGPEPDRITLFEHLRRDLLELAPVLLVVDDAQWADEPSLRALLHLVRQTRDARLAVCLTVRSHDAGPGWRAVGGELRGAPGTLTLPLGGLRPAEALACLRRAAAGPLAAGQERQACVLAGGNPFYLHELGRTWGSGGTGLPGNLTELVSRRVQSLSPHGQELLSAAAVLGEAFDLAVVARLVDRPVVACLPAVDEALSAGLLRRDCAGVRFAHGLFRSALEDALPLQALVPLHLRAAAALEELHASDLRPVGADLARHWCAVAVTGEREPGVRWATAAAETAQAVLAWEESARLYELALATGGAQLGADRRAQLLLARAAAQVPAGQLEAAHAACREAVALARAAGRADLVATAALTLEAIGARSWDRDVGEWCREALSAASLGEGITARLLARLTEADIYGGSWHDAQTTSAVALSRADQSADPEALVAALRARQLALSGPEHSGERRQLAERMIGLAVQRSAPADEMWGLLWRIDVRWEHGELAGIAGDLSRLSWCVDQVRTPLAGWHVAVTRAALAQAHGQFEEAERVGRAGWESLAATGHPAAFGAFLSLMSGIGHHAGYAPVTVRPPEHLIDEGEVRGQLFASIGPAMALAESGRLDEAAALYRRPGPPQTWVVPPYFRLVALGCACAVAALLHLDDDVRWYRRQLEPWRGRHVVGGAGAASYLGPVELALGAAAAALGDLDAAERDLTCAARTCSEIGAPAFAVEAQCRLAEVLVRQGRTARGQALARPAVEAASRLGMPAWERRLRAVLTAAGSLTAREREVATLLAEGRSNRDIAVELVVSERTAENHVQSILRKLGLSSRSQVAAWAAKTST